MISAKPSLDGVLACGTDGEKAIVDGFKRNFCHATFLRCFLHFKDNIDHELTKQGIPRELKLKFIEDIFGKQVEERKFEGLVDSSDEKDFEVHLEAAEQRWNQREGEANVTIQESFFQWFRKNKVTKSYLSCYRSKKGSQGLIVREFVST